MVTKRQHEERILRQDRILDGALQIFSKQGLESATMEEIAKESDFGKATLYYYFCSKEEIFQAIMIKGWKQLWINAKDLITSKQTPRKTMLCVIMKIVEIINKDRSLYEFLFFAPQSSASLSTESSEWKKYQLRLYSSLEKLVEEGVANGKLPAMEPNVILQAMGGLFHGMMFVGKNKPKIEEADIEQLLSQFLGKTLVN